MPTRNLEFYYWDSCVFLSYINAIEGRVNKIEELWEEISQDDEKRIVASAVGIVEVACASTEREQNKPNPQVEKEIDAMWRDPSISMVEVSPRIAFMARELIRDGITKGWVLKTYDAIHLATAMWVHQNVGPISEFHTYDGSLKRYSAMIGVQVYEPRVLQPKLI